MAWLIAETLKLAGHFRVHLTHASKPQRGQNSCGIGNGCPSCEGNRDNKQPWVRQAYNIFTSFDTPPSTPPPTP